MEYKDTDQHQWYNTYTMCYCHRAKHIQLGWKLYGFINILFGIPIFLLALYLLPVTVIARDTNGFMFTLIVLSFISTTYSLGYYHVMKKMKSDGHSKKCTRKTSFIGSFYFGTWSDFIILDKEKDKN